MSGVVQKLAALKELVFETDNKACFIERDRILSRLEGELADYNGEDKYARALAAVLSGVSTPIHSCDYFAGRVVEGPTEAGIQSPHPLINSLGHMSFDYEKVLKVGLKGILEEINQNANKMGDERSLSFAKNATIVVTAIKEYCDRYAAFAKEKGFEKMAEALEKVPFEPAYDFYSALQSVWIIHMIASCYVGDRDYAFGRFDKYMLPFYQKALKDGQTEEELTELLAGFMIKTNEICGRATHNHDIKPIGCQASKQYINIGGESPNVFSSVVLKSAMLNNMAQPQIVVLLKPEADEEFTNNVFKALSFLNDKMNIYNYEPIYKELMRKGVEEEVAKDFTYSACCTLDLNYHTYRNEYFTPVPQIFVETLNSREYNSVAEILRDFEKKLTENIQVRVNYVQTVYGEEGARKKFVLDSLLLSDSTVRCRYPCDLNAKYYMFNIFCPGIATVGDSLMVLDKLVFKDKRYTFSEFMKIVNSNFENEEDLLQEIQSFTMFGNDSENDQYTVMAGRTFVNAVDNLTLKSNFYAVAGFYSLERENSWKNQVPATPNGRKAGEPFSENQSPTYGADKNGITALLKSLAKLPLDRTATGGLNLTFSGRVEPQILKALVLTYFQLGGFHVGISVIDRETLTDAMIHPDKYKSLTVRLYGFSEYFVSLPKWQQIAVLNRTEYNN